MTSPKTLKNLLGYFYCMQGMISYALAGVYSIEKKQEIYHSIESMRNAVVRTYGQLPKREQEKIKIDNYLSKVIFDIFIKDKISVGNKTSDTSAAMITYKTRIQELEKEILGIHSSKTYKIGRVITWLPRKVRGMVRCYNEHGLAYTFYRILFHLHLSTKTSNSSDHSVTKENRTPLQVANIQAEKTAKNIVRDYEYYSHLDPSQYENELKLWYSRVMKKDLNLDPPVTYDEKIQWLKLYDSTPIKTRLADKYLVRDWVSEKIGEKYLIPILGVWDNFDEIDFDKLPNQFVLKANHGCGWNIIVKNKAQFDVESARKKFAVWMKTNFAFKWGLELHYMNIKPKIIAEQYLENDNNDLYDYKVFCFNGKAESIMYLSDRKNGLKMAFYDLNWNKLPFVYSYPLNEEDIPRPAQLEKLIELAEKLAEGFAHVRVDFYILNDGSIKFGEMTFTSAGGACKWNPPEQDRIYGDLIKLPPKSPIPERKVW